MNCVRVAEHGVSTDQWLIAALTQANRIARIRIFGALLKKAGQ